MLYIAYLYLLFFFIPKQHQAYFVNNIIFLRLFFLYFICQKFQIMEANISTGKSKAFGIFFRCLQQSIGLGLVSYLATSNRIPCSQSGMGMVKLFTILGIIIIILSIISLLYVHCREKFGRIQFFVVYGITFVLFLITIIFSFITINKNSIECAEVIILQKWAVFNSFRTIIITLLIMFSNLFWALRVTNSPGNLTLTYMFLSIGWNNFKSVQTVAYSVGIIYLVISLITFGINIGSLCSGITTCYKKLIKWWWISGLIIMIVMQILIVAIYVSTNFNDSFYNVVAKELFGAFLAINFIDLLFWFYGLFTITYQNGDLVRDQLIQKDNNQINQQQQQLQNNKYENANNQQNNQQGGPKVTKKVSQMGSIYK